MPVRQNLQPKTDHAVRELREALVAKLVYALGTTPEAATDREWYTAIALTARDRATDVWMRSARRAHQHRAKRAYYLSIEFLIGRLLIDTLSNLGLLETTREAIGVFGKDLDRLRLCEPEPGLGSGGLGRLAACYLDSMSTLGIPAFGYGIRYEHGLFEQRFHNGWQVEFPDHWLAHGTPWEFPRVDTAYPIHFGGAVEYVGGDQETAPAIWYPAETIIATAHDLLVTGWGGRHANTLRLWRAQPAAITQLLALGAGSDGATSALARAKAINNVLYPDDSTPDGQELRLRQEFFFTSASLQDLVHRHLSEHESLNNLADFAAVQLNDTHPAIAVAELMRILVDEHGFAWKRAWDVTRATLSYTNHTLLPEALESWSVALLSRLLPRHLQIIYLINWLHLQDAVAAGHRDADLIAAISLIDERGDRRVRMGHLAFIGSHTVNGVSTLHTKLMQETVFAALAQTTHTRIVNKTNGISLRRWLYEANPALTTLIRDELGEHAFENPQALRRLEQLANNKAFVTRYRAVRHQNKLALAETLQQLVSVTVSSHSIFDVHIKRIHEYKRQLLNILETIALWRAMRAAPDRNWPSRVKIFAGKAAGSYDQAKLIIKLAHDVAKLINNDPLTGARLKLVFVPNYGVDIASRLVCAADVSEQISTAGMEASGTGNMKLALNGAITIGTLDGATVEIRDHVGADNVVTFGLTAAQVTARRHQRFAGRDALDANLTGVIETLESSELSGDDRYRYAPLVASLLDYDPFMVAADFSAYWAAQRQIDARWQDSEQWWQSSILNTARMGWFSSDRAIREYADDIWRILVTA